MPRPGPRPYECIKRAWHSDRHQPVRGSLIQEIFRVVNEIHTPATKKNKEWQEKLPVVVLKAEEIMYSKANSEAEYMDLKTILDRTNDAINTIIRLDESTETEGFLQPCIEAALHLGCTPRRASRSQRNVHPRCYLSPNSQEPNNVDNSTQQNQYPSFMKPPQIPPRNSSNPLAPTNNFPRNNFPFIFKNDVPSNDNRCLLPFENCPASKFSVYPLYYGSCYPFEETKPGLGLSKQISNSNTSVEKKLAEAHTKDIHENPSDWGCDLSLRLGPLSVENSIGSGTRKRVKLSDGKPPTDKRHASDGVGMSNALNSPAGQWASRGEFFNLDTRRRKQDTVFGPSMEDQWFSWPSKRPYENLRFID